jgi:hypothetical protein
MLDPVLTALGDVLDAITALELFERKRSRTTWFWTAIAFIGLCIAVVLILSTLV